MSDEGAYIIFLCLRETFKFSVYVHVDKTMKLTLIFNLKPMVSHENKQL